MTKLSFALYGLIGLISIFILTSCSTDEVENESPRRYSESTQREFEQIERGEVVYSGRSRSVEQQKREDQRRPMEPIKTESIQLSTAPAKIESNGRSSEHLQEINQNLAYYCMKHRTDRLFKSEEKCTNFTKKILTVCESQFKKSRTKLLACVKTYLKKGP